jgi:glycosyltransferase involved in cell wall biosynthesis
VLRLPFNLGIGGAVQSGYHFALENGYDVAVQVDGDGQHDARCLNVMLDRLRSDAELNMVTGSRFLNAEGDGYRSSASRRLGIRIFGRVPVLDRRPPGDRPDVGLRMTDTRGIELFARDYPHDYPEVEAVLPPAPHRSSARSCPCACARARRASRRSTRRSRPTT